MDVLEKRLRNRGTEKEEVILKRLDEAKNEIRFKDRYRFNVVNGELDKAVDEVLEILHNEIAKS